ncbi:hypothetical protein F2P47_15275 [Parvibaculum sedimenti]|uniref:RcnB family protein n=1 Tax=Parvibaculum sedimenti TaxID=2608632 RepID=A0A6N6VE27_9HYPH|nr:RcnB family protein [Parvibaculum sedimenti]KAB7738800.1 hypothetical protein F2P47_15275 [Parvibaculum sedimenti]
MTSKSPTRFVALLAAAAIVMPTLAFADDHRPPPGQGQGQPQHRDMERRDQNKHQNRDMQRRQSRDRPEFRYDESRYARDYYRKPGNRWDAPRAPRGFGYGHRLPRNYWHPLPPGLRGHFHPRPGYDYYMVGNDIVLVAIATGIIVDILYNVNRY